MYFVIVILYGIVSCVLKYAYLYSKKKSKKKLYIFLSLETKRSLEWKKEKNTKTDAHSHFGPTRRVGTSQFMWAPQNAVWNGKPNEYFKNTIKQRRGCRKKKIVCFLSKFTIRSYFLLFGCGEGKFSLVVDSFHHSTCFFYKSFLSFFHFDLLFFFWLRIWKYLWLPLYACALFLSRFSLPLSLSGCVSLFFRWLFHLLFYVLKLFYDYYSVDMNIYWKIISMTHQFCWLIQKQKPTKALKCSKEGIERWNKIQNTKSCDSNGTTLFCAVDLCMQIVWQLVWGHELSVVNTTRDLHCGWRK